MWVGIGIYEIILKLIISQEKFKKLIRQTI